NQTINAEASTFYVVTAKACTFNKNTTDEYMADKYINNEYTVDKNINNENTIDICMVDKNAIDNENNSCKNEITEANNIDLTNTIQYYKAKSKKDLETNILQLLLFLTDKHTKESDWSIEIELDSDNYFIQLF
ncbi:6406_t:CDS:2, partial [Gigaspora margarita]